MPRVYRTNIKERLKQYKDLAWQLRMACRITLDQVKACEIVDQIVRLHIKFEHEDNPGGPHGT